MILSHRARLLLGAIGAVGLALAAQNAAAQQGTLSVIALVEAQCSVDEGSVTLNFGTYDPNLSEEATAADTTFNVSCTAGTDVKVSLDDGENPDGNRRLSNGASPADFLTYRLWQDAFNGIPFGQDGTFGQSKTIEASTTPTPVNVVGTIFPNQPVPAGEYFDTVQIILTVLAPTS